MDIILFDKTKLRCYDLAANVLFSLDSTVPLKGVTYYFDSEGSYFILNTVDNEIRVISASDSKVLKKFKVSGEPLVYDLFKEGKIDMITSLPSQSIKEMVETQIKDFQSKPPKYLLDNSAEMITQYYTFNVGLRDENRVVFAFRLNGIGTFGTEKIGQGFR